MEIIGHEFKPLHQKTIDELINIIKYYHKKEISEALVRITELEKQIKSLRN